MLKLGSWMVHMAVHSRWTLQFPSDHKRGRAPCKWLSDHRETGTVLESTWTTMPWPAKMYPTESFLSLFSMILLRKSKQYITVLQLENNWQGFLPPLSQALFTLAPMPFQLSASMIPCLENQEIKSIVTWTGWVPLDLNKYLSNCIKFHAHFALSLTA